MNKDIINELGEDGKKWVVNVERKQCPSCGKSINEKKFRDKISMKEYKISGLCQSCQDEVFD
jgi:hypothetical protein